MPACLPSTWEAEAGGSKFRASLGYIVRPWLTKINNKEMELESYQNHTGD
jgi:hypothetical protein